MSKVKIKDIARVVNGSTPSTDHPEYYDGDIVWVTPKDLSDTKNKYITKTQRSISQRGYDSCSTQMLPKKSLLMSSRAPIGLLAINLVECCTNQGFKNIIVDESVCDIEYLYYYFQYHMKEIEVLGSGTTFKEISKESLENYMIELPSLSKQKVISKFLSELDNKIQNNDAINSELEAIAKTIYDYWFLQFEFPDENGKPYKSSGGKMVWNEGLKREIPEGWEVNELSSFINIVRGVSYSPDDISTSSKPGFVPLLKSNNLQNGKLLLDDVIYVPEENVSKNQYLTNNSLFVTMSSGSTEHVGKIAIIPYDTEYCYGAFCSKIEINPDFRCFISSFFLSDFFKRLIRTIVIGTSIKNISNEHLTKNLIPFPNESNLDIIKKFENVVTPMFDKQGEIIKENQELAKLRDFLLPLLMNGQVGFKETK